MIKRTMMTNLAVMINPVCVDITFLYPVKTSENQSFSDVLRGYRKRTMG